MAPPSASSSTSLPTPRQRPVLPEVVARALTFSLAVGLGLAAALAVTGSPRDDAIALRAEHSAVPANGVFAVTGHGYGHGHGMSQYGAQGAALQGLSTPQILGFYYPGTSIGTVGGSIRVRISADTDDDVRVLPTAGLSLRTLADGATSTLPGGRSVWRLRPSGSSTVLDHLSGSTWTTDRTIAGDAEFFAPGPVTLRTPGGDHPYRGALRLAHGSGGWDTVNVVGVDDYTRGVVPREMPASWQPAAVRTQAVAARTYAVFERGSAGSRDYDLCDTSSCQVYGGLSSEDSRSNTAVAGTAGQVLMWQGAPAYAQFSSSSGGWMSDGGKPYLVAKADPYDGFAGNPVHTWTTSISAASIRSAWPQVGTLRGIDVTRRDGNGDFGGRVVTMVLDGTKSDVTLSGATFKSHFGLRSDWFSFGGAPTAAPASPGTSVTPITVRWRAMGGNRSRVGKPAGPERAVAGGAARSYRRGAIFWSPASGAHEMYGRPLRFFRRHGGPGGSLGFPTSAPQGHDTRQVFQHGTLSCGRRTCSVR